MANNIQINFDYGMDSNDSPKKDKEKLSPSVALLGNHSRDTQSSLTFYKNNPSLVHTHQKISDMHNQLQGIVTSLVSRIGVAMEKEGKEILSAYKTHLLNIQTELTSCKKKLDLQEQKIKQDGLKETIKEELEYYKKEYLIVNKTMESQRQNIQQLKEQLSFLEEEKKFLENQVKKSKKESLTYKLKVSKYKDKWNKIVTNQEASFSKNPDKSQTFDEKEQLSTSINEASTSKNLQIPSLDNFIKQLKAQNVGKDLLFDQFEKYIQSQAIKYNEIIGNLQQQLNHERKIAYKMRTQQTKSVASRSELEQLFCDCAEETRIRLFKKKSYIFKTCKSQRKYVFDRAWSGK